MIPPLVSVLMPVYNAEPFLKDSIESILTQTFTDFEFIIIDDGSTDNSKNIILSYNDKRIKYFENENNIKLIATLNRGLELVNGKYIVRMDADDISLPNRIAEQVKFMEDNPDVGVCGAWYIRFDGTGESKVELPVKHNEILFNLIFKSCPIAHPSVIIRTSIIRDFNLTFSHEYAHAEDYHLWSQLTDKTKFYNIPQFLLKYRQHNSQVTNVHNLTNRKNTEKIKNELFDNYFTALDKKKINLYVSSSVYYNQCLYPSEIIDIASLFNDILTENRKRKHFEELMLRGFFSKYFIKLILHPKCYSIRLFIYVLKAKSFGYRFFSEQTIFILKFFLKCISGYENTKSPYSIN